MIVSGDDDNGQNDDGAAGSHQLLSHGGVVFHWTKEIVVSNCSHLPIQTDKDSIRLLCDIYACLICSDDT